MPRFKFVIACEKIIAEQTGPISIISMFQKMRFQMQPGVPMPEKAVAPNRWFVLTLWEMQPEEVGKDFTQLLRVYAPDGSLFSEHEQTFRTDDPKDLSNKLGIQLNMIPLWQEGDVEIKVSLKGQDDELGSYKFGIEYVEMEDTPASLSS